MVLDHIRSVSYSLYYQPQQAFTILCFRRRKVGTILSQTIVTNGLHNQITICMMKGFLLDPISQHIFEILIKQTQMIMIQI